MSSNNIGQAPIKNLVSLSAVNTLKILNHCTDMPYVKEISNYLKNNNVRGVLSQAYDLILDVALRLPIDKEKLAGFFEGRQVSSGDAIEKFGRGKDISVLEIASGFSPRGIIMSEYGVNYLETDLGGIIKLKEDMVRQIAKPGKKNHLYAKLNVLERKDFDKVGKIMIDKFHNKPVAIVNEGLLMYFDRDKQRIVRDNIAYFLNEYSPNGAWITPDFSFEGLKGGVFTPYLKKALERFSKNKIHHFEEQSVKELLSAGGLEGERLPNSKLIDKLTCIEKKRLKPEKIKRVLGEAKAWHIVLKN